MNQLLEQLVQLKDDLANSTLPVEQQSARLAQVDAILTAAHAATAQCASTEAALQASMEKCNFYEASLDALPNPIFVKNEQGAFVYFNKAYQQYFQMERAQYLGKTVLALEFLPMEERERYHGEDLMLIETGQVKHYEINFDLPSGGVGESLYWSKGFAVSDGGEKGLVGEIVDITLQKKLKNEILKNAEQLIIANKRIEKLIKEDSLTGLYNRRAIDEIMENLNDAMQNKNATFTILMADLDHFKKVNDTFGHASGDDILVSFSRILLECTRPSDTVIRFGGEEFLVILQNTAMDYAYIVAERIRAITEKTLLLPNGKVTTVSIGVSRYQMSESVSQCIQRADKAMYRAKKQGRNQVV